MTRPDKDKPKISRKPDEVRGPRPPDWTEGLKRMYDAVVEEPLPEAFKDLLARLDGDGQ